MNKPKKVMLIGSGPIVIGQASEFDYSGVQALKALKQEGISTVVVNSNLATIMTDPELADSTYMEALTPECLERIIEKEKPDAILNTLGGQTGLNLSLQLLQRGLKVQLIGAEPETVRNAEDRHLFKACAKRAGLRVPESVSVKSVEEGISVLEKMGYPGVIRPFFTLGGAGGSVVRGPEEAEALLSQGIDISPVGKCLVEKSLLGWREFELEVVVDGFGNSMVVCSIENLDPMGVHTGDSITVAPALTLDDITYQKLRTGALDLVREIGVKTGGCNVQFAVNPNDPDDFYVIEVNPRVSRSSALASKATGFPIAWVAVKVALGYSLDQLRSTGLDVPASFEPTLDYIAVKMPRFDLEKFPGASQQLSIQMKSVGEAMAMGRSFPEALQKAVCSLETGHTGLNSMAEHWLRTQHMPLEQVRRKLRDMLVNPNPNRIFAVADALRWGFDQDEISKLTGIHRFFISEINRIIEMEDLLAAKSMGRITHHDLLQAKKLGFSDRRISELLTVSESVIKEMRHQHGLRPGFLSVDTCAGEHPTKASYHYSSYWSQRKESRALGKDAVVIIGAGPSRIGQSLEFDYSAVQAVAQVQKHGLKSIMLNSNPETVSTDHDVSDRLYFEPVDPESVLEVLDHERPLGVMVQFGGQTPLNFSRAIKDAGHRILGTQPETVELAEDRQRFWALLDKLGIARPAAQTVFTTSEAEDAAEQLGYPLLIRPSFVLGGRRMQVAWSKRELLRFVKDILNHAKGPVSLDRFFLEAKEYDVEVLSDGKEVRVMGVIEHIQEAGVHSGDSSGVWPPVSTPDKVVSTIEDISQQLVASMDIVGLANIQLAWFGEDIYVLELNPRASRTVPFLSKATGIPLAKVAASVMLGKRLKEILGPRKAPQVFFVKEPVFSFPRLPGAEVMVGPEMRSTGEAAGIAPSAQQAVLKGLWAAGWSMPEAKSVYISARDSAKPSMIEPAGIALSLGYEIISDQDTGAYLRKNGFKCKVVEREALASMIARKQVACVIDVPETHRVHDTHKIRWSAFLYGVPCFITSSHARLFWRSLKDAGGLEAQPMSLQEIHGISGS